VLQKGLDGKSASMIKQGILKKGCDKLAKKCQTLPKNETILFLDNVEYCHELKLQINLRFKTLKTSKVTKCKS